MAQELFGLDAFDMQETYLRRTPKPQDLTVTKWIQQLRNINNMLPYLSPTAEKKWTKKH